MRGAISLLESLSLGNYLSLAECESLVGKAILYFFLFSRAYTWHDDYFGSTIGKLIVTKPFLARIRFSLRRFCIENCVSVKQLISNN